MEMAAGLDTVMLELTPRPSGDFESSPVSLKESRACFLEPPRPSAIEVVGKLRDDRMALDSLDAPVCQEAQVGFSSLETEAVLFLELA